jgi:hypothetical protein
MTRQKFGLEAAAYLLAEYKTGKRQFTDRRKTDRGDQCENPQRLIYLAWIYVMSD